MKHLLLTTIAAVMLVGCGPSKNEFLVDASQRGDMDDVRYYLDAGADPNARDVSLGISETPLHRAAVMDWRNMAELLIAKGADVNAKGVGGTTPLDLRQTPPRNRRPPPQTRWLARVLGP